MPARCAQNVELRTKINRSTRCSFSGRDSVVKYQLSEIEYERRTGYRWYVDRPAQLFK
jgi:hypothetical protein